ncbi:MAG: hypothetical protein COY42_35250 [Armatimonadetes bacterium CG_4_10_14_0_8_um_filter_66_14]|nr:hypothetical protein [Armatimonadota bacterium]NDK12888.1 hypothetical protein [Armatimonadota bacterium]PIZ29645.1 MAG: hypothetical protein COY42_35250 [Armatimonadetes bacterium CG_4_10_14_0_8_um_filter_66_14]PJB72350.1 MAG: hypothetical protein CO096_08035 [Armatimonadetes bacterium CG_4_9_14_3_um_filter_66_14]
MTTDVPQRLNALDLVSVREHHFRRLVALFEGAVPDPVFVLCGIVRHTSEVLANWEQWLDESLEWLAGQVDAATDREVFRPLAVNHDPDGVHFVDHLFGADVSQMEDRSWQVRLLETPVGQLDRPDFAVNATWRRTQAFARAFVERGGRGVILGTPTLSSALNVAVNLYGQRIFEALLLEPEAAKHDLRVINEVICDLHRWYLDAVPAEQLQCIVPGGRRQPPGCGQLCGCACQVLSAEQYREFVAPLDEELLSLYPNGGMIHLCGVHTQHVPVWREMSALRAVQVNDRAAEELALYFGGLRENQLVYVDPCAEMPVEHALEIAGGRRLVLAADLKEAPRFPPAALE